MKLVITIIIMCLLSLHSYSQAIITPDKMTSTASGIQDKLVELALQNPNLEVADHQIAIAKYHLKEAKGWWLNNISLSFNANDFTVKRLSGKTQPNGQLYPIYPLYNFGLNIPIGGIFSKPAATKAAREQVAIEQANRNSTYRQIRATVLSAYEDYIANRELLTVQSQLTESAYNDLLQAKQKFRNGQISVDDYNQATQLYNRQLMNRINAQHSFNLTQIQLEAIIGVPLSQVISDSGQRTSTTDTTAVKP